MMNGFQNFTKEIVAQDEEFYKEISNLMLTNSKIYDILYTTKRERNIKNERKGCLSEP